MTPGLAKQQISKAIEEYDEETISKAALSEVISHTIEELYTTSIAVGAEYIDDDEDDEIVFEAEMDLEEPDDFYHD